MKYLYDIPNKTLWEKFKKTYKERGLTNLTDAITEAIKQWIK